MQRHAAMFFHIQNRNYLRQASHSNPCHKPQRASPWNLSLPICPTTWEAYSLQVCSHPFLWDCPLRRACLCKQVRKHIRFYTKPQTKPRATRPQVPLSCVSFLLGIKCSCCSRLHACYHKRIVVNVLNTNRIVSVNNEQSVAYFRFDIELS